MVLGAWWWVMVVGFDMSALLFCLVFFSFEWGLGGDVRDRRGCVRRVRREKREGGREGGVWERGKRGSEGD